MLDIHNVFLVIYHFYKAIGLAPFSVKFAKTNQVKYSKTGTYYISTLILIIFGLSFLSMRAVYKYGEINKTKLLAIIYFSKAAFGIVVLLLVWSMTLINQKCAVDIFKTIFQFNNKINKWSSMNLIKKQSSKFALIFLINLSIWIVLFITDIIVYPPLFPFIWISIHIPSLISNWLLIQYAFAIMIVRYQCKCINLALNHNDFDTFKEIRYCHQLFSDFTRKIVSYYSFSTFIIILYFFASIMNTFYYFVLPFIEPTTYSFMPQNAFASINYFCMEIYPLIILTSAVSNLKSEMAETCYFVSKHRYRALQTVDIRSEIKVFTLELLMKRIDFTAFKIFPLHRQLLSLISGLAITYLIVLVQIKSSSN